MMTRLLLLCSLFAPVAFAQIAQEPIVLAEDWQSRLTEDDLAHGKRLFEAMCARCHGIGGSGGEGPPLTSPVLRSAPDDPTLLKIIQSGIPGTEMPGTWRMTQGELERLGGYIRSLGQVRSDALVGGADRGRAVYERNGTCGICHIINGEGGGLGPDLSDVGARRGAEHLREALVDPGANVPLNYVVVRIVTSDGREVRGLRLNEDPFTIQIKEESMRFHSFRKRDLKELEKELGASLMPSYENDLTPAEIDDLVAYLAGLRGTR